MEVGYRSANFAAAKRPGEHDSDAAVRLGASWVGGIVAVAKAVQPQVRVYFYNIWAQYNAGFQSIGWQMAEQLGLADMPSFYERPIQNDLQTMAAYVRAERLTIGTGSELIPWLTPGETPGTDGPHSADPGAAMFNSLIQAFASGATGFNVFDDDGESTALSPLPLISSYKSEKSLCGTGRAGGQGDAGREGGRLAHR